MIQTIQFIFCLTGFVVFLIGFILIYALISAILLSCMRRLFTYDALAHHPNLYRSCLFYDEQGQYRSLGLNWVCHCKPLFHQHWANWLIG